MFVTAVLAVSWEYVENHDQIEAIKSLWTIWNLFCSVSTRRYDLATMNHNIVIDQKNLFAETNYSLGWRKTIFLASSNKPAGLVIW